MPIPKTAIEYLKSERAKQTVPYQKFYDEAIAALEKVNVFQNGNDHSKDKWINETTVSLPYGLEV